jgi:hypothetical protein
MSPSVLTLIHDLADAIALADAEAVGLATVRLGVAIGNTAALAIAEALAREARPLATLVERPELARCA